MCFNKNLTSIGLLEFYLKNDYEKDKQGPCCYGYEKYLVETLYIFKDLISKLYEYSTPLDAIRF